MRVPRKKKLDPGSRNLPSSESSQQARRQSVSLYDMATLTIKGGTVRIPLAGSSNKSIAYSTYTRRSRPKKASQCKNIREDIQKCWQ